MNCRIQYAKSQAQAEAFVFRDLVICLSILALITVIQLPLLGESQSADKAALCRNNLRQLILAWQMFSSDNLGQLAPNNGSVGGGSSAQQSWVTGWLDFTSSLDNINTDYLISYQKNGYYGHLGPYLKDATVFRCPSDTSQAPVLGFLRNRVRTVSMNNWMGSSGFTMGSTFRVFKKQSDIVGLSPANAWVIQDEREDSINDSELIVDMHSVGDYAQIVDYPASYHQGGGQLAFADGHVGHHVWQDKRTNPELVKGVLLQLAVPSPNNPDLEWLQARTTVAE